VDGWVCGSCGSCGSCGCLFGRTVLRHRRVGVLIRRATPPFLRVGGCDAHAVVLVGLIKLSRNVLLSPIMGFIVPAGGTG
jgi:hypothetical protein